MEKKIRRDSILYAHITKTNHDWIKGQMKKLGYNRKTGKSEFLDKLLTVVRIGAN